MEWTLSQCVRLATSKPSQRHGISTRILVGRQRLTLRDTLRRCCNNGSFNSIAVRKVRENSIGRHCTSQTTNSCLSSILNQQKSWAGSFLSVYTSVLGSVPRVLPPITERALTVEVDRSRSVRVNLPDHLVKLIRTELGIELMDDFTQDGGGDESLA